MIFYRTKWFETLTAHIFSLSSSQPYDSSLFFSSYNTIPCTIVHPVIFAVLEQHDREEEGRVRRRRKLIKGILCASRSCKVGRGRHVFQATDAGRYCGKKDGISLVSQYCTKLTRVHTAHVHSLASSQPSDSFLAPSSVQQSFIELVPLAVP